MQFCSVVPNLASFDALASLLLRYICVVLMESILYVYSRVRIYIYFPAFN